MPQPQRVATDGSTLSRNIQTLLCAQHARSVYGSLGETCGGAAWCLAAALAAAGLLDLAASAATGSPPLAFGGWFLVCLGLLAVALVVTEVRGRRDDVLDVHAPLAAKDAVVVRRPPSQWDPLLRFLTWGPRNVVDGVAGVRRRWRPHQVRFFRRAARVVLDLAKYPGGMELKRLVHPPEDMRQFMRVIDWLDRHEWVGRSTDQFRVWISTDGVKRLEDAGLMPPDAVKLE
ncbi:MAG TPA: hypothetical protein VF796_06695 [Humisphaera sp.]